jgi:hypothetical protein
VGSEFGAGKKARSYTLYLISAIDFISDNLYYIYTDLILSIHFDRTVTAVTAQEIYVPMKSELCLIRKTSYEVFLF